MEVSHDGEQIYVANFLDDSIAVFDAASLERLATLETENYAHEIALSPDGGTLIVPGYSSNHIRIYDTRDYSLNRGAKRRRGLAARRVCRRWHGVRRM